MNVYGGVIIFGLFLLFWSFFVVWPAGRGLGGVQAGAEAAGSSRGAAGRGPSLYAQVDLEAIYGWKPHTVLT